MIIRFIKLFKLQKACTTIGFFEYYIQTTQNFFWKGGRHHHGALPFNHPQQPTPPGRPVYTEYFTPDGRPDIVLERFTDDERLSCLDSFVPAIGV